MAVLGKRRDNPEARMSIGGHLREFRNRAVISLIAILVFTVVGWQLWDEVFRNLREPLLDWARRNHKPSESVAVNYDGPTDAFTMRFKVAAWLGLLLASPIWLWQIWAFLVPGLTSKERRMARLFFAGAVPLFIAGLYVGYRSYGITMEVLLDATPDGASNITRAQPYFAFVSRFILAFGLSFMFPILLMALNTARVLPARRMIKGWRFAIIAIVLFSAIMTPTGDVWTMFVMSAPLLVLYYLTVAFAAMMDRVRARREKHERPAWMDTSDTEASPL